MVNRKHCASSSPWEIHFETHGWGLRRVSYFEAGQISRLSKSRHLDGGLSHERFTVLFVPWLGASHHLFPFTFPPTVKMTRW